MAGVGLGYLAGPECHQRNYRYFYDTLLVPPATIAIYLNNEFLVERKTDPAGNSNGIRAFQRTSRRYPVLRFADFAKR